jgi:hypothetical protein
MSAKPPGYHHVPAPSPGWFYFVALIGRMVRAHNPPDEIVWHLGIISMRFKQYPSREDQIF